MNYLEEQLKKVSLPIVERCKSRFEDLSKKTIGSNLLILSEVNLEFDDIFSDYFNELHKAIYCQSNYKYQNDVFKEFIHCFREEYLIKMKNLKEESFNRVIKHFVKIQ